MNLKNTMKIEYSQNAASLGRGRGRRAEYWKYPPLNFWKTFSKSIMKYVCSCRAWITLKEIRKSFSRLVAAVLPCYVKAKRHRGPRPRPSGLRPTAGWAGLCRRCYWLLMFARINRFSFAVFEQLFQVFQEFNHNTAMQFRSFAYPSKSSELDYNFLA